MIPADLLDQLQAKDPELYERITKLAVGEYESESEDGFLEKSTVSYEELFDDAKEAWLLYCLMQAIRARGWHYSVSNVYQLDGARAMVFDGHQSWWHGGSTEAEALCAAYLAALEATE